MIREWLARKLFPQAFEDAKRYDYLRRRLDDLQTWCGHEEPELEHAIIWAKKSLNVYFMPLDEYHRVVQAGEWPKVGVGPIDAFREEMRARRKGTA